MAHRLSRICHRPERRITLKMMFTVNYIEKMRNDDGGSSYRATKRSLKIIILEDGILPLKEGENSYSRYLKSSTYFSKFI